MITAIATSAISGTDPPNAAMSNAAAGALALHPIPPNLTLTILLKMTPGKVVVIGSTDIAGTTIDHTAVTAIIAKTRTRQPKRSY